MMWLNATIAGVFISCLAPQAETSPELEECLVTAVGDQAIAECVKQFSSDESYPTDSISAPSDSSAYQAEWLPACPTALPGAPGRFEATCAQAHTCADPALLQMAYWVRQTRDAEGRPVTDSWHIDRFECRDPADLGPVQQELGWFDVLSAVRRIGVPASEVQVPRYTLVNLETTFYTEPLTLDRTLQIIGYTVDVRLEPVSYVWHWGDGSTTETSVPGRPYPSTDVTHTYLRSTAPGDSLSLSVDVLYRASYRVDGGSWQEIPDTLTISGTASAMPVKQASAVLVTRE